MTFVYALICVPFLLIAVIVAIVTGRRMSQPEHRRRWIATGVGAVVLFVLTAVFDSIMIFAGLIAYGESTRLGATVGLAPIEDFAYPIAAVLLVPAVWSLVRQRAARRSRDDG